MSVYRRVTYADRCLIFAYFSSKMSITGIADALKFHKSTIQRELKRNSPAYAPKSAQARAEEKYRACRRRKRIAGELEILVRKKLQEKWSPEQIALRLKKEKSSSVSHATIYRYLEEHRDWQRCLRRFGKKRGGPNRRRGNRPPWAVSIDKRAKVIEERKRYGDWERDTMYGQNRAMMLVCCERKSKLIKIARVKKPASMHLTEQTKELLAEADYRKLRSITNDNGGELLDGFNFSVPVYYCDPGKPQQRGTVENSIGLLRQYLPRGTDLTTLSEEEIKAIENELNLRPRKCLDGRTPYEVFFNKTVALAM